MEKNILDKIKRSSDDLLIKTPSSMGFKYAKMGDDNLIINLSILNNVKLSDDEWWYVLKDAKLNRPCVGFLPLETLFLTGKNVLKEDQFIFLINETFKNYKDYTNLAIAIINSGEFFEGLSKNIKELLSYAFIKMNTEDIDNSILIYERDFGNLKFDTKKNLLEKKDVLINLYALKNLKDNKITKKIKV